MRPEFNSQSSYQAVVAQRDRAWVSYTTGCGFDSCRRRHLQYDDEPLYPLGLLIRRKGNGACAFDPRQGHVECGEDNCDGKAVARRKCNKHYLKWLRDSKPEVRLSMRRLQRENAAWIAEVKSVPCMDCGDVFPFYCMDFDHRPDEVKEFAIGASYALSRVRLEAEIAKCDIICSNCHRIRTFERQYVSVAQRIERKVPDLEDASSNLAGDSGVSRTPSGSPLSTPRVFNETA